MEEDIEKKFKARNGALNNLIGSMEEDDGNMVKSIVLKITSTPEGIQIEKTQGEGTIVGEEKKEPSMNPGGFEALIEKKKRENPAQKGY